MMFCRKLDKSLWPGMLLMGITALPSAHAATPDAGQSLRELQAPPAPALPERQAPVLQAAPPAPAVRATDAGAIAVKRVRVTGSTAFPAATLEALVADLPGDARTLDDLYRAADRIGDYYRRHGYLLARAYLPAQEITDGVVTIAVLEGRLGKMSLDNKSRLASPRATALLENHLPQDRPVASAAANRALLLLQDMPGVAGVKGSLSPGEAVGSTDLAVQLAPGALVSGNLTLDNAGNRYSGKNRLLAGLDFNSLAGLGDRLALSGAVTEENRLGYVRAAWDVPVGSDGLRLGVAASRTDYELGEGFVALDAHGEASTASVYGSYPLQLALARRAQVDLALEHRALRDDLAAFAMVSRKAADVAQLTFSGDFSDSALGSPARSAWRLVNVFGDLELRTDTMAAMDAVTARTEGNYYKATLGVTREQALPANFSFYLAAFVQAANKNLDSSEKFLLGGPNGVRAYPQGEGAGDQGWLGSAELRFRVTSQVQLTGFFDGGAVEINRNPYIAQDNNRQLSGSGIGVNAGWGHWTLKSSLAWRGGSEAPVTDSDRRPRGWLSARYEF